MKKVLIILGVTMLIVIVGGLLSERGAETQAAKAEAEAARVAALTPEQKAAEELAARNQTARFACRTLVEKAVLDRDSLRIIDRDGWAVKWNKDGTEATVTAHYAARNALGGIAESRGSCKIARIGDKTVPLSFTPN